MFTVVLLSDSACQRFETWRSLFEPYEVSGDIAVCEWNDEPGSRELSRAIPDLGRVITGRREWRVLVVEAPRGSMPIDITVPDNPYDYRVNRIPEEFSIDDDHLPLVRISHMLLGYPALGPRGFVPRVSYWDADLRARVFPPDLHFRASTDEADREGLEERVHRELIDKSDVRIAYELDEYGHEARQRHRLMADRYSVRQSRPSEVVFIATRERLDVDANQGLRQAWGVGDRAQPSTFVERNGYPPSCRFTVYEKPPEGHSDHDLEEMKFWLSVLSLAKNDLPASSLQADHLYRVDVHLDESALADRLNEHLGQLTAVEAQVDTAIQRRLPTMDAALAEVVTERPIHVSFDMLSAEGLRVSTQGYSWASDVPSSEWNRWAESLADLEREAAIYMRRPRRVLAASVEETRLRTHRLQDTEEYVTQVRRDEIAEELSARVSGLIEPTTTGILDRQRLRGILDSARETVERALAQRMDRSTILWAVGLACAAWAAGLLPYLIQSGFIGWDALGQALLVLVVLLAVIGAVALVSLRVFRRRLVRVLDGVNQELASFTQGVASGAAAFGRFLTDVVTYMHGRATLISSERKEAAHQRGRARLAHTRRRIARLIQREKKIVTLLGRHLEIDPSHQGRVSVTDDQVLRSLLWLPIGHGTAELNSSGQAIPAPYDFVTRLSLVNLSIREPEHDPLTTQAADDPDDGDAEEVDS